MTRKSKLHIFKFCSVSLIFAVCSLHLHSYAFEETSEEIKLYVGEVEVLAVSNPTRIAIGNPNIMDVTNVTKNEMTLSPKAAGITTLVFWDNFGEQSYKIRVVTEDMLEIKRRVDHLIAKLNLPEVYTQAEDEENKVLLLGKVKSAADRELIALALGPLKEKTTDLIAVQEEEAVVEIDVQVLELSKDATNTLGFSWPSSITLTDSSGPTSTAVTGLDKVFHLSDFTRSAFNITVDALVQEGKARILSRPRLACQSGKEAELLVGGEKPIFTTAAQSTVGSSTSVEYKEFGIKLKIKPTVFAQDHIKLALNVEVSEVGTAETIGSTSAPTAKAYPLSKRTAVTELSLLDGQTLAIGGLMKHKFEEDVRKTSLLGDLPILGILFRKTTTKIGGGTGERGDTELFITLTPTIISGKKITQAEKVLSSAPANVKEYSQIIQKRILENLAYPIIAKETGLQGIVKLSLHLTSAGKLLETKVKASSGNKILDEDAVSAARKISTYPTFPASIESKELWIDVPIIYTLD